MSFDLIIWDCDGCLVDSEAIACTMAAEHFTKLGYPLTLQEYVARFAGRSLNSALGEISREMGQPFDQNFDYEAFREELWGSFKQHLHAIDGVADVLPLMGGKRCVASGSSKARVRISLELTGLKELLDAAIFSTSNEDLAPGQSPIPGKPAPDVFILACETMGVPPARTLIIEDSPYGVMGARAAGATVFGFLGGSHVTQSWRERVEAGQPDLTFDNMRQLPELVKKFPCE